MKKLIFLVCNVFLASLLLVVNPAQASTKDQTTPNYQQLVGVSMQATPELTAPTLNHKNDQIINHFGCGCSACVQANFHRLQGKLPLGNF